MSCSLCESTASTFVTRADRRCAFAGHLLEAEFRADNAHCATMQTLRGLAPLKLHTPARHNACLLTYDDSFVVLRWRTGHEATIDSATLLVRDTDERPLTLDVALALIAERTKRGPRP
jgi:hypothetical protein